MNKKELLNKLQREVDTLKARYEFLDNYSDKFNYLGQIHGLLTAMLLIQEMEDK